MLAVLNQSYDLAGMRAARFAVAPAADPLD